MIEKLAELFASLPKELYVFIISILPVIELRGSIPTGAAMGIPFYLNYLLSVMGNLLPIPFILLFIPKILDFLGRFRIFRPIVNWLRRKAEKNKGRIIKDEKAPNGGECFEAEIVESTEGNGDSNNESIGEAVVIPKERKMSVAIFVALMIFVAIPFPGTGAWTGSLVAALFDLPKKQSFLAVMLGVMISGIIMCLASYGTVGFLKFLI